jgi:cobalt/nickel transport system permease protein
MSKIPNSIREMYALERLSAGGTAIHRLHPAAKLFSALFFIATVASFGRYALLPLTPFAFYPAILMALSETPHAMLLRRFLVALPFCLFAGASIVLFDRATAFTLGGFAVSLGALSLAALLLRAWLCVMAALILIATTRMAEITAVLRRMRAPAVFVSTIELTYRYAGVLLSEAAAMRVACILRGGGKKGIEMRHMGAFVGQLAVRAFDRAERVYAAMKCRGYTLRGPCARGRGFSARDALFTASVSVFCVFFRAFPIDAFISASLGV